MAKRDRIAVKQQLSCICYKPWNLVVNICTTPFNMSNLSILNTRYILVFHIIFKIYSLSSSEQHYYLALHEGVVVCFNEELNDLYSSPNIVRVIKSRRMRWAGHVARMGEERDVYRVLVGKPEGKRPLGRPRRRWVDNIRMDLQEVGCGYMDWIGLAQDMDSWRTLVHAVMNFRVP